MGMQFENWDSIHILESQTPPRRVSLFVWQQALLCDPLYKGLHPNWLWVVKPSSLIVKKIKLKYSDHPIAHLQLLYLKILLSYIVLPHNSLALWLMEFTDGSALLNQTKK